MSKLDILDKYDYNIYVADGEVSLSAYRQCYETHLVNGVPSGRYVATDTRNYTSLRLPMNQGYAEEIAHLLAIEDWQDLPPENLEEFDEWPTLEFLTRGETPAIIKSYLEHLPDYELE